MPTTLYLRLSDTHLCFARYEGGREPRFDFSAYKMRPLASLMVNLREAIGAEPILQEPTGTVQVLATGTVTPVPLADFQEEFCETLYDFCFPREAKHRVFYDVLPTANVVLLFALDEAICHTLEETFGSVHYVAGLTPVLRHFSTKGTAVHDKRLFAYCHEQRVDVAAFDHNRLLLVNTFDAHAPVDVAYYLLNAARHLGVEPRRAPLYVAGSPHVRGEVAAELRKYAAQVLPVVPSGEFNRHVVARNDDVPYDLTTLLIEG